jgi:hypothetical protein
MSAAVYCECQAVDHFSGGNAMRRTVRLCLLAALVLSAHGAVAQENTKQEEKAKPLLAIKVQVVFSEYDGEKKLSSMPYSFIAIPDEKMGGLFSTSLRTGIRIPVEVDGKDQKTSYMDVGSNIDCGIRALDDGRFHVYMNFDRSSLYSGGITAEEKVEVSRPNNQPLIRQFRSTESMLLKDGQTSESIFSTDPLTGHVLRVSVTINVLK